MTNILMYMPTPMYGGVRTVSESLAKGLTQLGYNITFLFWKREYGDANDYIEGFECKYLVDSTDIESKKNIYYYRQILCERSISVVINQHGLYEGYKLINRTDDLDVKIISVLHSNPVSNYDNLWRDLLTLKSEGWKEYLKRIVRAALYFRLKYHMYKTLVQQFERLYKSGNYICVLSTNYIKTIARFNRQLANRTIAIPNPNSYNAADLAISSDIVKENIVLFVGRLDNRSKKLQYLVDIWRIIMKHMDSWKLVIVGSGADEHFIRKRAEGCNGIEFVGHQDPRSYYARSKIFCLTSIFEGFPMCVTEAMQYGCVPVAFNSFPAISDIIEDRYNGLLIKAFNKREYADGVMSLMSNSEWMKQLSENAKISVRKFDAPIIIQKWADYITTIK